MFRTILAILGIIFAVLIIYFVFFFDRSPSRTTTPLNVNLEEIKPPEWEPYNTEDGLVMINIDHDAEPEWLFFYKDGYGTNQIGGVIYDAQNRPRGESSIPISSQTSAYLIPYNLFPDYPPSKNMGYLGDENVDYKTVGKQTVLTPTPTPVSTPPPPPESIKGERLIVLGKLHGVVNRVSMFWWVNPEFGYSGALAYTPGWFSLSSVDPNAWSAWNSEEAKNIANVWAWEPQVDRSNICRVAEWQLQKGPNPPMTWHYIAQYDESSLRFCSSNIPLEPAFPEGQVLAYLFDKNSKRWKDNPSPQGYDNVQVYDISVPPITDQPFERPIAPVDVDFRAKDGFHSMRWILEMIPPTTVKDPVRWRILSAEDR